MAPVISFYFQEGCDREVAFTARGQMFMNTLSKELWVTYGPPVVSYPTTTSIFSKHSPQISQNQSLEEESNGLCVGATP